MRNLGTALLSLLGTAAAPGFAFIGKVATGLFGRSDGGLGVSVNGTEVARYEGTGRKYSREIDYAVARMNITGGGLLTYTNGIVKWTNRFIMIPVPLTIDTSSHINLYPPSSGTSIPVTGGDPRVYGDNGVVLNGFETLYAVLKTDNTASVSYFICGFGQSVVLADNVIPLVSANGDFGFVRFITGDVVYNNATFYNVSGIRRVDGNTQALVFDDGAKNHVFSSGYESRLFNISYKIDYQVSNADTDNKRWRWTWGANSMSLDCVNDAYSAASPAITFVRSGTVVIQVSLCGTFLNIYDNLFDLGGSSNRWKNVYLGNQPTVSSDEQLKFQIRDLSPAEIKAWESVSPKAFRQFGNDGPQMDQHVGYIAQDVERAFAAQGLDAFAYGILTRPNPGGYMSLRYGEAAVFEAAYQRSRVATLEKQVAILAASIGVDLPEE